MQFRPCCHQQPLPPWHGTTDQFHRAKTENAGFALVIGIEGSSVMRRSRFGKHRLSSGTAPFYIVTPTQNPP